MAAPIVTGLVGLVNARFPHWTGAQIHARLLATADALDAIDASHAGLLGAGRVNALKVFGDRFLTVPADYRTFPKALAASAAGDTIAVRGGLSITTPLYVQQPGRLLLGGWDASFSTRDPGNPSHIQAFGIGPALEFVAGIDSTTVVDGFRCSGGTARMLTTPSGRFGGGVLCVDASPVLPVFIPEEWSDETVAAYKGQLVLANLVRKMNFKGKKGDTIHIPNPARGDASVKAASTQVTLVTDTAVDIPVLIDKHYEYSHLFEDIAEMQALASMRRFYTDAAGYGLAKRVDRELHKVAAGFNGGTVATATALYEKAVIGSDGSTNFSGSANTNSGNGATLTDAAIRKMIQTLEDQDVNSAELNWALPPAEINRLRGLSRFTEQAFVGDGRTIRTGQVGDLYGTKVYSSTQCPGRRS